MICFINQDEQYTLEFYSPLNQEGSSVTHIVYVRAFWRKYVSETRYLRVSDMWILKDYISTEDIVTIGVGKKALIRVPEHIWDMCAETIEDL